LATEGAIASLKYGFEVLGLKRIISIIHPKNVASQRVAEKAGLTLRGETRFKGFDVIWYAIERGEWAADGPSSRE
jgi:RimJ/RimL family protein N-acetyltransferase